MIYYLLSIGAHELFHASLARSLGYKAQTSFYWFWGYVSFQDVPVGWHAWAIPLIGGLAVALLYILISHFTEDWETDMVLTFFAPLHGSYAVMEALWFNGFVPIWAAKLLPLPVAVATLIWRLMK
jgi:hypothetical protein